MDGESIVIPGAIVALAAWAGMAALSAPVWLILAVCVVAFLGTCWLCLTWT